MKINYFSDLHLEFGSLIQPDNDAELIIAAGDIGLIGQGLEWLKTLGKPVIYVAGNHEFYTAEYYAVLDILKSESVNSNVYFLENDSIIYNEIRFLGCSLWTNLHADGYHKAMTLGLTVNDFRKISFRDKLFTPTDFSQLNNDSIQWLEQQLSQPFDGKTIVVTHHAPTELSWNREEDSPKRIAYCNRLESLINQSQIEAWFHGHIHSKVDEKIANTRILSNTRGYFGYSEVDGFDVNEVIDI